jgi:autotransporter-associated beta strand protein
MLADQADAVRPGVNGVVYNAGTIKATSSTGSSSDGVDVQNSNGVMITNDITGLIEGARHGITGGAPNSVVTFTTSVTNEAGGVIKGLDGSGINLDGFNANQSATIINHGTISGFGVTDDGDGVDVDGIVNLTNTGTIRSGNAFSSAAGVFALSEGISAGGGTITNSGTIEGLVAAGNATALGRGISLVGIDVPGGTREAIYANTTVNNNSGGLIRGSSDSGIAVGGPASGFTVTINNEANATIRGGGALAAAILAGADKDTINNAGLIDGSSSGLALSLGAGDDNLNVTGGDASILGDIDGGTGTNTMKVNPGAGKLFAYAGSIKNFNLVELTSGTMSLSGVSTYTGTTKISGGVLELDGANRLSQSSKLNLNGGTLALKNAGPLNGQSFACLSLSDDSTIDLGGTSLTFGCLESALTGKKLSVENYSNGNSPSFAFRLFGDVSGDSTFTALMKLTTVNGLRAVYRFDGTYTDVTAAPEPSTMALMALGALMIPLLRRRTR